MFLSGLATMPAFSLPLVAREQFAPLGLLILALAATWFCRYPGKFCSAGPCAGPRNQKGCRGSSPRRDSLPVGKRLRGALFICLLLSQHSQGVQIWAQGFIQGQPVFDTSRVPHATDVAHLQPVRSPDLTLAAGALHEPTCFREVGVFAVSQPGLPQVFLADERTGSCWRCGFAEHWASKKSPGTVDD